MNNVYKNFYRNFYIRTGGFIPTIPLNLKVYPGDFFQIRNGEMIRLGNIFRTGVVKDDYRLSYGIKLNEGSWRFSDGVSKPYSGRGTGHGPIEGEFEFSKQILSFDRKGSFMFNAGNPETVKIENWTEFQQQLIIKLTQTMYSFRELYIVTECATAANWTLAVAGAEKAELEIVTGAENFGLVDIFGNASAKTVQSKEIEYYHREAKRTPVFFKAKKLAVQDEKIETFINDFTSRRASLNEWAFGFFKDAFEQDSVFTQPIPVYAHESALDMLPGNQLNPNTALLYFKWVDASMDDIEKLFLQYGH